MRVVDVRGALQNIVLTQPKGGGQLYNPEKTKSRLCNYEINDMYCQGSSMQD